MSLKWPSAFETGYNNPRVRSPPPLPPSSIIPTVSRSTPQDTPASQPCSLHNCPPPPRTCCTRTSLQQHGERRISRSWPACARAHRKHNRTLLPERPVAHLQSQHGAMPSATILLKTRTRLRIRSSGPHAHHPRRPGASHPRSGRRRLLSLEHREQRSCCLRAT